MSYKIIQTTPYISVQLASLLHDVVVHLPGTQHHLLDLLRRPDVLVGVGDQSVEPRALVEQLDVAERLLELQQLLVLEQDQRLPEVPPDLPPQHVEQVRRCAADAHLHVAVLYLLPDVRCSVLHRQVRVVVHQLQVPFDPSGTVLWSLAVHAVGEHDDESALDSPLGFAGGDEVVDHDLRSVGEVSELGLPEGEAVGVLEGVAVVEAEDAVLAEEGVVDVEEVLLSLELPERVVLVVSLLVVDHRVAVREGASLAVLPAEPHRVPLVQQGPERQGLRSPVVDVLPALNRLHPSPVDLRDHLVRLQVAWQIKQLQSHLSQLVDRHPRVLHSPVLRRLLHQLPRARYPIRLVELLLSRVLVPLIQSVVHLLLQLVSLLLSDHSFLYQLLLVTVVDRYQLADLLVHDRLGEHGLVLLVVAIATIPNQVDDDVSVELLSVPGSHLEDLVNHVGVFGVDVHHGSDDGSGDVGAVQTCPGVGWHRGEADLVVHHDMDGALYAVPFQAFHLQGLEYDALA